MRDRDEVKVFLYLSIVSLNWHTAKPGLGRGPGLGPVQNPGLEKNPDSTLGLTFEKSRTCLHKTRTQLMKKTDFKTGLIKKRGFKSVAHQSVICLYT